MKKLLTNLLSISILCFCCTLGMAQAYDECGYAGPSSPATAPADATNPAYAGQVICSDGAFPECSSPADAAGETNFAGDCGSPNYDFVITNPGDVATGDGGPAVIGVDADGAIDPSGLGLAVGDNVCVTGFCYDLVQLQTLVDEINNNGSACSAAESLAGAPVCPIPVPNSLQDLFNLAGSIGGGGSVSVGDIVALLPQLDQLGALGITNVPVCGLLSGADPNAADYCMEVVDCAADGSPCEVPAACAIEADLAAPPAPPVVTESTCGADDMTLEGGEVAAITCPPGSTAEYSIDGGTTWATTVPAYDQTTAITVTVRCLCDEDMMTASPTSEVTTVPGMCPDPAACAIAADLATAPAPPTVIESVCGADGMTLEGGSIDYAPTMCPAGSTMQFSTDGGATWVPGPGPMYDQMNAITFSIRCLCDEDMMTASPVTDVTTVPGSCGDTPPDGTAGNCGIIAGEPTMATATVCNTELGALDVTAIFGPPGPAGTPSLVQNYAVVDPATGDLITISSTATLDLSMVAVGQEACVSSVAYTQETLDAITGAVDGVTQFPGSPVPAFGMLDLSGFLNGLNGVFEFAGFQFTQADLQTWCETQTLTIPFSLIPGGLIPDLTLDLMTLIPPDGFCCDFSDSTYCLTVENCLETCDPGCANEMFIQIESIEVTDPVAVVGEINPFGDFNGCAGAGTLDGTDSFIELDLVINGTMLTQISIDGGTAGVTAGPFGGFNSVGMTACDGTTVDAGVSVLEDDSGLGGGADDITDNATQTFDIAGGTYTACGGGIVITYTVQCGPPDCAAMCANCVACDVVACDPLISTTTAPPAVVTSESTCEADGMTLSGGVIGVPAADCPAGSTLEYSIDAGATWSTTLPMYDQVNPVTVDTRCVCDSDDTDISTIASVTTVPGSCMMDACEADAPEIDPATGDCAADDGDMMETPFTWPLNAASTENTTAPYITEYIVVDAASGTIIGVFPTLAAAEAAANAEITADVDGNSTACIQAINHEGLTDIVADIDAQTGGLLCTAGIVTCPVNELEVLYGALAGAGAALTVADVVALVGAPEAGNTGFDLGALLGLPPGALVVDVPPFCYELGAEVCATNMACDAVVMGCTDPCADNFDATATMDDGSCNPYDMTCNADCTAGPFGGAWDPATCACTGETAPVNGCTDPTADNYDAAANCDDGSCMTAGMCNFSVGVSAFDCIDGGTMDPGDDTADITFVVMSNGSTWTSDVAIGGVMAGGDGMMLTETGVAAGTVIMVTFTSDDDPTCTFTLNYTVPDCTVQIPTLSQWGLISLALLLMIMGSLKLAFSTTTFNTVRKK